MIFSEDFEVPKSIGAIRAENRGRLDKWWDHKRISVAIRYLSFCDPILYLSILGFQLRIYIWYFIYLFAIRFLSFFDPIRYLSILGFRLWPLLEVTKWRRKWPQSKGFVSYVIPIFTPFSLPTSPFAFDSSTGSTFPSPPAPTLHPHKFALSSVSSFSWF